MRPKNTKQVLGVVDGLDFGTESEEISLASAELIPSVSKETKAPENEPVAEIDPTRSYSKYYTPKPKLGSKGGYLGRGAVDEADKKVQFSLTCTPAQKAKFMEAAKKDKRKLPDFICIAVEEYIEKHNL